MRVSHHILSLTKKIQNHERVAKNCFRAQCWELKHAKKLNNNVMKSWEGEGGPQKK